MFHDVVIVIAKYLVAVPVVVSGLWWLLRASRSARVRYLVLLAGGGVVAYALSKIGGHFYDDPRPFIADQVVPYFRSATDNGFPSDHTLFATVVAAAMWPFDRRLSALFYVIAVAVGLARVVAGVHHGVDVIGGLAIGTASVALVWQVQRVVVRAWPATSETQRSQ